MPTMSFHADVSLSVTLPGVDAPTRYPFSVATGSIQ